MHKDTLGNEAFSPYGMESIYPWMLESETVSSDRDASLGEGSPSNRRESSKRKVEGVERKEKKPLIKRKLMLEENGIFL